MSERNGAGFFTGKALIKEKMIPTVYKLKSY